MPALERAHRTHRGWLDIRRQHVVAGAPPRGTPRGTRPRTCVLTVLAAAVLGGAAIVPAPAPAQPLGIQPQQRKATTVNALLTYPVFFNTQLVRVRGEVRTDGDRVQLVQGTHAIQLAGTAASGLAPSAGPFEISGRFADVGRLESGDPRLEGIDINTVWHQRSGRTWPSAGEVLVLIVQRADPATPFPAPSVRALALDPSRYAEAEVTVTGRFRGRNLYADQPDAPGRSRWDFVLQAADASIWVAGVRPKGPGFNLDVDARVDTGRWLDVAGTVRVERGLVVLEAATIQPAKQPVQDDAPSEPVARVTTMGPAPEVVFSAPTAEETDVPRAAPVRIQFSRDIDPASIKGQVRVQYIAAESRERGEPPALPPPSTVRYNEGTRVLEIIFDAPLERFRSVRIELGAGIRATDGAMLSPWTLTFSVGG